MHCPSLILQHGTCVLAVQNLRLTRPRTAFPNGSCNSIGLRLIRLVGGRFGLGKKANQAFFHCLGMYMETCATIESVDDIEIPHLAMPYISSTNQADTVWQQP